LPDPRLDVLARMFASARIVPATVSPVDIAGTSRASEGAGWQQVRQHPRGRRDCQVVRVFDDPDVVASTAASTRARTFRHRDRADLADFQTLEKAVPRLKRRHAQGPTPGVRGGVQAARCPHGPHAVLGAKPAALRELSPLTTKPFLTLNADEAVLTDEARQGADRAGRARAGGVPRRGRGGAPEPDEESAAELLSRSGRTSRPALARAGFPPGLQTT
jgi:hypothetical protein